MDDTAYGGYVDMMTNDMYRSSGEKRDFRQLSRKTQATTINDLYRNYDIPYDGDLYFIDRRTGRAIDLLGLDSIVQTCANLIGYKKNGGSTGKRSGIILEDLNVGSFVNNGDYINKDNNIVLIYKLLALEGARLNRRVTITISTTKFQIKKISDREGGRIFIPLYERDGEGVKEFLIKEELEGIVYE